MLTVSEDITLIVLPPYRPQLNPIVLSDSDIFQTCGKSYGRDSFELLNVWTFHIVFVNNGETVMIGLYDYSILWK